MSALKSRLAKLESASGRHGRHITVRSSQRFSDAEVQTFLVAQGVNPTRHDRITRFLTTWEQDDDGARDVGANPWVITGMQIVNVRAMNAPGGLVE